MKVLEESRCEVAEGRSNERSARLHLCIRGPRPPGATTNKHNAVMRTKRTTGCTEEETTREGSRPLYTVL